MHAEWIDVSIEFMELLIRNLDHGIFCVGTTSIRTIESLYWMGLKTFINPEINFEELQIKQWDPYEADLQNNLCSAAVALKALIIYLKSQNVEKLFIQTQIIIAPGYEFKIAKGMITNFHQPKSTLLLLVSAMIGENWKDIYEYALTHDFRFLSYGDGCLIYGEV